MPRGTAAPRKCQSSVRTGPRLLFLFVALTSGLVSNAASGEHQGAPDPGRVAGLVFELTNQFRAQQGRGAVVVSARLNETAYDFADYLAHSGKFSHEADGATPEARARKRGYDYCIVSENIAYEYSSTGFATEALARGFVEGWEKSIGHRRNMLDTDVTETGVAVARGKPGHYYAVQMFGRPASQAIRFRVTNRANGDIRYRVGNTTFRLGARQTRTHTQCRSDGLTLIAPGEGHAAATPKNGDSYSVVRSRGGFSMKVE